MSIPTRERSDFRHRRTELFLNGITLNRTDNPEDVSTAVELDWYGVGLKKALRVQEDFLYAAGATLPLPWGEHDTSAAGSPTTDYVDDAAGGIFRLQLAATNETETIGVFFSDQLVLDVTKNPRFACRIRITSDGAALGANEIIVAGLASARDNTFDNVTTHAWFRFEGANNNILTETDDGTTDDDDNDTGIDWVKDAWLELEIDAADLSAVEFYVNGVKAGASLAMAAATGNLQPFIFLQKSTGTTTCRLDIDMAEVASNR